MVPLGIPGTPTAGTGEVEPGPKGLLFQAPCRLGIGLWFTSLPAALPELLVMGFIAPLPAS